MKISEPGKQQQIAALAYKFWEARGCPEGTSDEDWFLAERERAEAEAAEEADITALRFPVRSEISDAAQEQAFQKKA